MASTPVLNIRLTGEENVTVLNENITWVPVDKTEIVVSLISTDSPKTINFSTVSKVKTMVFYGTGSYKVTITTTIGTDPSNTIAFETSDFFVFSPTEAFRDTIDSVTLSTTSTSTIEVQARIYGY